MEYAVIRLRRARSLAKMQQVFWLYLAAYGLPQGSGQRNVPILLQRGA